MNSGLLKTSGKHLLSVPTQHGMRQTWYTGDDKLSQFLGLNFIKNLPDTFRNYCQSAICAEHHQENTSMIYHGSEAAVIELGIEELTVAALQTSYSSYAGANLILTYIPKVCYQ